MVGRGFSRSAFAIAVGSSIGFAGISSAQPFDPAQPDVILWGSAGFTDLAVLSVSGRGSGIEQKSDPTDDCPNLKEVASVLDSGSTIPSLATQDKKNGKLTEMNYVDIGADANGRVFGIAEFLVSDGNMFEASATGKSLFSEKASTVFSPSGSEKGGSPNEFVPLDISSAERKFRHRLTVNARSRQAKATLKISDRSVLSGSEESAYNGLPLVFSGKLNTNVRKIAKGKSDVVVTGIIDRRSDFLISADSITADPSLRRWNGDAELCTPFNQGLGAKGGIDPICFSIPPCDAPFLPNGFTRMNIKWYDSSKKKPAGRYKIRHDNEFENAKYRANSSGYMLSDAGDAQMLVDGDISLSQLQYRARNFTFRTPAANTRVKTTYSSDSLLQQFPGGQQPAK